MIFIILQVDEFVYAAFDDPKDKKWLAQIVSAKNNRHYDLYFMDGDVRDDVPENQMRKVSKKQSSDGLLGKRFFDDGDEVSKKGKSFHKGEFTVLIRDRLDYGDPEPCYWCERDTHGSNIQEKRDIQLFGMTYITDLIDKYDNE